MPGISGNLSGAIASVFDATSQQTGYIGAGDGGPVGYSGPAAFMGMDIGNGTNISAGCFYPGVVSFEVHNGNSVLFHVDADNNVTFPNSGIAIGTVSSAPNGGVNISGVYEVNSISLMPSPYTANNFVIVAPTGTTLLDSGFGASSFDLAGAAATAQSNAESYALSLGSNYDPAGAAATAQSNAESFATSQGYITSSYVIWGNLGGSPPGVSTFANDSNYATQTYVNGQGFITNATASISYTQVSGLGTAALAATTDFDAAGSASTAQSNAEIYATSQGFVVGNGYNYNGPISNTLGGNITVVNGQVTSITPAA